MMKQLPNKIDFLEMEQRWESLWEQRKTYRYDWNDNVRKRYSVDTPPPYPSGEFHMGNVLNWTYFDIRARYKRMQGYNVHFPQGWDCHGMPTEVAVEKNKKIRRSDVPPDVFRKMCEEWVEQYIGKMKEAIVRLGASIDWSLEYRTMEPSYIRKIQLSFLQLYEKGFIYRGEHPVNYCPRCETAIADAEVERLKRVGKLYSIAFNTVEGDLIIATTRPEYIPACVAIGVNPNDKRYNKLIGKDATTPIFNKKVPIIAKEDVDTSFGTGVMMICTYGDKADVIDVARFKLPIINILDKRGQLNEQGGKYKGLSVIEARKLIVEDLKKTGLLKEEKPLDQEVGTCWRCDTPIEVVNQKQWFMKTTVLSEKVVKQAKKIDWFPDYMRYRLINWTESLDWDWVLSRQRVFATPVPVWYCKACGEIHLAEAQELPVDTKVQKPRGKCSKCGSSEFIPDYDVMDTWFDSSMTCPIHAGWPDMKDWHNLFPASVHPSGQDIIRTWAYYLMVRSLALFNEPAYNSVLINGMVLGGDGRKMSKSLGNFVTAPDVFNKQGADAARQWAACGGSTGTDIPFRWEDVEYGKRFMTKIWNASRFAAMKLEDYDPNSEMVKTQLLDRWILTKLEKTIAASTEGMEKCEFMNATEAARNFTWHIFCDHYIEAVKWRLYSTGEEKIAAQQTIYHTLKKTLQLLAPVIPHLTEELYDYLYAEKNEESIHTSQWPTLNPKNMDAEAERIGDLFIDVITGLRKEKNQRGISLNKPVKKVTIYSDQQTAKDIKQCERDLKETLKIEEIYYNEGTGEKKVEGREDISFTLQIE
ncbi:valine--tRNA ligase [Candidatus Bathyarchaeota archaeon]|nr:valine--tRNA ligase [Candidatus Bathyarchaeota archaeon]